jgi:hypothetical protein
MAGMNDSGQYPPISPDRTKVSLTLAKVFVLAGALAVGAFTFGQLWADQRAKLLGIESRMNDLPTKRLVREQVDELAGPERIREVLRTARWQCPLVVGRGRNMWVECRIMFPPNPPK